MLRYLQVFNFLWRGKRIEFILSGMWRNQMAYCRQLNNIPGSDQVSHNHTFYSLYNVHIQ